MSAVSQSDIDTFRDRIVGRSVSEETFSEYERWIRRFEKWNTSPSPGLAEMEDFDSLLALEDRIGYPWSNSRGPSAPDEYSYRTRVIALSGVKKWVRRHYGNRVPEGPKAIALGTPDPFDPTYLSRERVEEIIEEADEACPNEGCAAALAVSYDAILRAVELSDLEPHHITLPNEPDGTARVDVPAAKGSRASTVTVSGPTTELLTRHLDRGTPSASRSLFTNSDGEPWSRGTWSSHVIDHHCPAGSHAFGRHSPILHMIQEAGFGPTYRRARHVNPETTAKYARIVGADIPEWATD